MELDEILEKLTPIQVQFVQARLTATSDAEAARAIDRHPTATYNWPNKELVNAAVRLARINAVKFAQTRLKAAAGKAVDVILDEMENARGSNNRLRAAVEVLDRIGLPKGIDITSGGESFVLSQEERDDAMAKFADVLRATVLGEADSGWDVVDAEIETSVVGLIEPS